MKVQFKPLGTLRRKIGKNKLILELEKGATVEDALNKVLDESDPSLERIVKPDGEISGNLILMLNKVSVNSLQGVDTKLSEGDEIVLLPHIQGGDYCWM